MKKILSIAIILLVILGSVSIIESSKGDSGKKIITEKIIISNPTIQTNNEYISLNFEESNSYILDSGRPMLPVFTKVFILPFGSKIVDVDVSFSNEKSMTLSKFVKPATEPTPLDNLNKMSTDTSLDYSIYDSCEIYPSESFTYSTGGGLDNNQHVTFLSVKCYPVRYSPGYNKIYYSNDIDVEVVYNPPSYSMNYNGEYDLVIITPSKFENLLNELVDHKNNYGVNTFLKTTEEIYSEYSGYDNPEKIKYFLKDSVEELGTEYALIVGDIDLVPIRYSSIEAWGEEDLPTDMYYADLYNSEGDFLNWDSNGNKVYGEWDWRDGPIDEIDLHPDIKIGRLPCRNKIDVLITLNKIIHYETNSNGDSWLDKIILMGGDTFPNHGVIEGELVTEEISQEMSTFESVKLWTSTGNFNPLKINSAVTQGSCFVSYSGHGYVNGFGTSPPNEDERIQYYTAYTIGMLNAKKYPVVFFDACSTTELDYEIQGIKFPCFAWYLIKKPIGGAIATIGSTRVAYTHVDYSGIHGGAGYLNVHFFKAYEPGNFVSDMMTATQNDYINYVGLDALTLEEFILLGDPSLKIKGYSSSQNSNVEIKETEQGLISQPNTAMILQAESEIAEPYTIRWDLDNDESYDDGEGKNVEFIWNTPGTYKIKVKLVDSENNIHTDSAIVNILSKPDNIIGPKQVNKNSDTILTINPTNDPSLKEVYYLIDFGDGTYSDVIGPFSDTEKIEISHKYSNSGTYKIKIKKFSETKDGEYIESTWSDPLSITLSKTKNSKVTLLTRLIDTFEQRFPYLFNLIKNLN